MSLDARIRLTKWTISFTIERSSKCRIIQTKMMKRRALARMRVRYFQLDLYLPLSNLKGTIQAIDSLYLFSLFSLFFLSFFLCLFISPSCFSYRVNWEIDPPTLSILPYLPPSVSARSKQSTIVKARFIIVVEGVLGHHFYA